MTKLREELEANRRLWNEWTQIHSKTKWHYDLDGFKKGGVRIREWEQQEVGDVSGKDLLHLQCHFGIDTLSWARLGARVTGADFSPEAIALARQTATDIGVDATFIESELAALPDNPSVSEASFDIVYASRGAINWIESIEKWMEVAAHFLRPGGFLYLHEGHPLINTSAEPDELTEGEDSKDLHIRFPYFWRPEPTKWPVQGSYADRDAKVNEPFVYEWPHGLGEIVTAAVGAGLRIDFLHEHPFLSWPFSIMIDRGDGEYVLPNDFPGEIPLMFSLKATKTR